MSLFISQSILDSMPWQMRESAKEKRYHYIAFFHNANYNCHILSDSKSDALKFVQVSLPYIQLKYLLLTSSITERIKNLLPCSAKVYVAPRCDISPEFELPYSHRIAQLQLEIDQARYKGDESTAISLSLKLKELLNQQRRNETNQQSPTQQPSTHLIEDSKIKEDRLIEVEDLVQYVL